MREDKMKQIQARKVSDGIMNNILSSGSKKPERVKGKKGEFYDLIRQYGISDAIIQFGKKNQKVYSSELEAKSLATAWANDYIQPFREEFISSIEQASTIEDAINSFATEKASDFGSQEEACRNAKKWAEEIKEIAGER